MTYLIGRPTLRDYVKFVRRTATAPPAESELVERWYEAQRFIAKLEKEEAGAADLPDIQPVDPDEQPLMMEFLKDPAQRSSFNTVPSEVAMVDLDQMVVYQRHIDVSHSRRLIEELGPKPSRDATFRTCLPFDHPKPPVNWCRVDSNTWVFVSPSNDLRFLGAVALEGDDLDGYRHLGAPVGALTLAVGFGTNFMNALHVENRLILHNGSHRAYALYQLGVRRVPCIVQHAPSREALELLGPAEVYGKPDLYLSNPRPPMLRDYSNPDLIDVFAYTRKLQQVTVKFETTEADIPEV